MSDHKYCVQSLKEKKISENATYELFDFGEALEQIYPLLQIIFENLPYEDLKTALLVNNTWNKYSKDELRKRNNASWLSLSRTKASQLTIQKSNNFKYDSVAFALIFYNYHDIKLQKFICVHDEPVKRMTFSEYLINEIVPKDIDFWVFSCTHVYSPMLSKGSNCSFTGLFIPKIPNINVQQFITPFDKTDHIFEKSISQEEHIHCILLFTLSYPNLILKKFTKELFKRDNAEGIAIGGGVISNGIKPFQRLNVTKRVFKSNTLFCIAFTEEKNNPAEFDAFSVVISYEVDFKQELINFKKQINLREHNFALRICCAAKDVKDIEKTLFNEVFPNTFLVGLDVDGEIGRDKFQSWQPEEDTPEKKKQKMRYCLCHQYTTIIVILSWGKKIGVAD
ncbi:hypothetical protein QE152_g23648 [Popillia japonica]|uniref:F-box domain-containing protein n=1 Tax=Popillia japonica TaxID=7064 RepID=A0AAW1KGC1_POPJA